MTLAELDRWLETHGVYLRVSVVGGVYAASLSTREEMWEERTTMRATGSCYSAALASVMRLWDAEGPRPGRGRLRSIPGGAA